MYTVYVIESLKRNYTYIGMTSNLEQRFNRHNKGQNKTTRPYAPFRIVYTEVYETRAEARKREKYFKSGVGREFIKSKIHELE